MNPGTRDSFVIPATAEAILTKASLASVLQVYSDDRKSTSLTLRHDEKVGHIHLRDGILIHADLEGEVGDQAFMHLASWEKPEVIIVDRLRSEVQTVKQSLSNLLLEAARLSDEQGHTQQKSPKKPADNTLKTLLQGLVSRPGTKGILIYDYAARQTVMTLGDMKFNEALYDFYISWIKTAKQMVLSRNTDRSFEVKLTLGDEQHLLVFPLTTRGICAVHVGKAEGDTQLLAQTLKQVALKLDG
jgi:hypothetical protein